MAEIPGQHVGSTSVSYPYIGNCPKDAGVKQPLYSPDSLYGQQLGHREGSSLSFTMSGASEGRLDGVGHPAGAGIAWWCRHSHI